MTSEFVVCSTENEKTRQILRDVTWGERKLRYRLYLWNARCLLSFPKSPPRAEDAGLMKRIKQDPVARVVSRKRTAGKAPGAVSQVVYLQEVMSNRCGSWHSTTELRPHTYITPIQGLTAIYQVTFRPVGSL